MRWAWHMLAELANRAAPVRPAQSADGEPLWLGPPERRLYAALHRATSGRAALGVVLAPPLLAEQPRSRRLLFEIAGELAAQGLTCLRFDYYGTGDSGGDGKEHDLAAMYTDFDTAVAGLCESTEVTGIAVMAWRGAALAACDWARLRKVNALVLWDPVEDGAAWLDELESADRRERVSRNRYARGTGTGGSADGQLMGMPASASWRSGIGGLRLAQTTRDIRASLWAVLRNPGVAPEWAQRTFVLPPGTPRFDGETRMDATLFLSRQLRALVGELGRALMNMEH